MITRNMLNEDQAYIVDEILDGMSNIHDTIRFYKDAPMNERVISISGSAGCGKSTLTSVLIKELYTQYSIKATTPTHKALAVLRNMFEGIGCEEIQATTIHSHLGLKVQENYHSGKYELVQVADAQVEAVDVLLIDEASMVSEELFSFIMNELVNNNIKVVIFIGDKNQLNPVEGGINPIYTNPDDYTCFNLTKVTRQAEGNKIIQLSSKLAEAIRDNKFAPIEEVKSWIRDAESSDIEIVKSPKEFLTRYYASEFDYMENLILAHTNNTVNRYNRQARQEHRGKQTPYIIPTEKLVFNEAHFIEDQAIHRNNEIVEVKACEQVEDEALDIMYWRVLDTEDRPFRVVDGKSLMDYEYELNELARQAKKEQGSARSALWKRFFELKGAFQNVAYTYACTVTKSQGSTCKEGFVDFEEIASMERVIGLEGVYRLLLVGMSRCSVRNVILMR